MLFKKLGTFFENRIDQAHFRQLLLFFFAILLWAFLDNLNVYVLFFFSPYRAQTFRLSVWVYKIKKFLLEQILPWQHMTHFVTSPRKTHDVCFDWSRANLSYVTVANMARGFAKLTKSTPCIKRIEDVVYLAGSRRILF